MESIKRYIPLTFAVIFAMLASVSVYQLLKDRTDVSHAAPAPVSMMPVVVAKSPIGMGEKLTEIKLDVNSWPSANVPEVSYRSTRSVVGKTARIGIGAGEPILESKLLGHNESLSSLIPSGMRAVTVPVEHSDPLLQMLERGARVDVVTLFTFEATGVTTAETIVERARVLTVHQRPVVAGLRGEERDRRMDVMLVVSPEEAKWIVAAMKQGVVELVVRNG